MNTRESEVCVQRMKRWREKVERREGGEIEGGVECKDQQIW